ncbi:MAG: TMEM198/TM7SF3 family protein [Blautia sp.]|nr:TMEM198/TM7SF3 family protein [Blautia sp.]MDY5031825.1 DUF4203 domain-containing protein [Blautia sp.]
MMDILSRMTGIIDRIQYMDHLSLESMLGFGILLVFGVLNALLGYRLLRFWMMLFGFGLGAMGGFFVSSFLDLQDNTSRIGVVLLGGVILAIIAFLIFRAGIFMMGAGLGFCLTLYVSRPTTSLAFFLCILAGVILGALTLKFSRGIIIVGTSILGGTLAGMSLAKLGGMDEIPFGVGMSLGIIALGMIVQFAINRSSGEDEEEEDEDNEAWYADDVYRNQTEEFENPAASGNRRHGE